MERITPSERIRKQLDQLLNAGLEGQGNLLSTLVQLGAQAVRCKSQIEDKATPWDAAHEKHSEDRYGRSPAFRE